MELGAYPTSRSRSQAGRESSRQTGSHRRVKGRNFRHRCTPAAAHRPKQEQQDAAMRHGSCAQYQSTGFNVLQAARACRGGEGEKKPPNIYSQKKSAFGPKRKRSRSARTGVSATQASRNCEKAHQNFVKEAPEAFVETRLRDTRNMAWYPVEQACAIIQTRGQIQQMNEKQRNKNSTVPVLLTA